MYLYMLVNISGKCKNIQSDSKLCCNTNSDFPNTEKNFVSKQKDCRNVLSVYIEKDVISGFLKTIHDMIIFRKY